MHDFERLQITSFFRPCKMLDKEPGPFYVLKTISDDQLLKIAPHRKNSRFPTACYMHKCANGVFTVLYRSGEPNKSLNLEEPQEDQLYLNQMSILIGEEQTQPLKKLYIFTARPDQQQQQQIQAPVSLNTPISNLQGL